MLLILAWRGDSRANVERPRSTDLRPASPGEDRMFPNRQARQERMGPSSPVAQTLIGLGAGLAAPMVFAADEASYRTLGRMAMRCSVPMAG